LDPETDGPKGSKVLGGQKKPPKNVDLAAISKKREESRRGKGKMEDAFSVIIRGTNTKGA